MPTLKLRPTIGLLQAEVQILNAALARAQDELKQERRKVEVLDDLLLKSMCRLDIAHDYAAFLLFGPDKLESTSVAIEATSVTELATPKAKR